MDEQTPVNRTSGFRIALPFFSVGIALTLTWLIMPLFPEGGVSYAFFFAILPLISWFSGFKASVLAAAISAVFYDFFFVPPFGTLSLPYPDWIRILIYTSVGILIAAVAAFAKNAHEKLERDVIRRKETEEALRRAVEFDEAIMTNMGEGLYTVDHQGLVTSMNPAAEKLFGWTFDELRGKKMHDVTHYKHPDGSPFPSAQCPGLQVLREGKTLSNQEDVFIRKDETFFDVLYSSSPIREGNTITGLVVVFRDTSERKRAEERLQNSERTLRSLADQLAFITDTAPVFIAQCDEQQRFKFINKPHAESFGLKPEECVGKSIEEIMGPAAYESIRKYVEIVLKGEQVEFEIQSPYSKMGTHFMHCSYAPEFDKSGNVVGWVAAITDITARKRAEELLRHNQEKLQQALTLAEDANRLKDEFLATVSHELRTPLNAILGWAHLLKMSSAQSKTPSPAINAIYASAKNQAQIVNDILDVARITSGNMKLYAERVLLSDILSAAIDIVSHAVSAKNIELNVVFAKGNERISLVADSDRLQQVFWNLISNAVKFTPTGGTVEIQIEQDSAEAIIRIRDTGIGIPGAFLPHIFERFRQADSSTTRKFGGVGLGLSIAKNLVELHGGTISAESEGEGAGSTFTVRIPVSLKEDRFASSQPLTSLLLHQSEYNIQLTGKRILAVDDDATTLDLLREAFAQTGSEFRTSQSAIEALGVLKDWSPHLLISDLAMPDQDGLWLIRELRSASSPLREIPAIALTAYASAADRIKVLDAGFQIFLAKPIQPAELIGTAKALIDHESLRESSRGWTSVNPSREMETIGRLDGKKILLVEDDLLSSEVLGFTFQERGAVFRSAPSASRALQILHEWLPDIIISDLGLPDEDGFSLIKKVRALPSVQKAAIPIIALTGYGKEEGLRALAAGFQLYRSKPVEPGDLVVLVEGLIKGSEDDAQHHRLTDASTNSDSER